MPLTCRPGGGELSSGAQTFAHTPHRSGTKLVSLRHFDLHQGRFGRNNCLIFDDFLLGALRLTELLVAVVVDYRSLSAVINLHRFAQCLYLSQSGPRGIVRMRFGILACGVNKCTKRLTFSDAVI